MYLRKDRKRQFGLTMLETMLVMVIGALIVVMGIRQYVTYKEGADLRQLQSNVDRILSAMSAFYKANCYGRYNPNAGTMAWSPLNMKAIPPPNSPYVVAIVPQLGPYMLNSTAIPASPLVRATGPGTNGYIAQFNRYTYPATICLGPTGAIGITPASGCTGGTAQIGTVVIWRAQVAVQLQNPAMGPLYAGMANATCLSNLGGGGVTPCAGGLMGAGNYLVWERQSTHANPEGASTYWPSNAMVAQFTKMYRTDSIQNLIALPHIPEFQYFDCGG